MNKLSIMIKSVMLAMSMVGMTYADHSWTGVYGGFNAGLIFNNTELTAEQLGFASFNGTCSTNSTYSTLFSGVQVGYLYQFANLGVAGIEANVNFNLNQSDTLSCTCPFNPGVSDRFSFRNQRQTSIRGRVGRALNLYQFILFPYVTAGASFANVGLTYKNEGGDHYSINNTETGWLAGAGIEWAFMENWSLRAEYYYASFLNTIKLNIPWVYGLEDPNGHASIDVSSNNFVVAINYWI